MMDIEEFQERLRKVMSDYVLGLTALATDYSSAIDKLMEEASDAALDDDLIVAISIIEGKKLAANIEAIERELS